MIEIVQDASARYSTLIMFINRWKIFLFPHNIFSHFLFYITNSHTWSPIFILTLILWVFCIIHSTMWALPLFFRMFERWCWFFQFLHFSLVPMLLEDFWWTMIFGLAIHILYAVIWAEYLRMIDLLFILMRLSHEDYRSICHWN